MSGLQTRDRPKSPSGHQLPIDPRIAARWIAVRQDESRRRWRGAVRALAGVTAVVGIWILAHSSLLAVRHVVVGGTSHTARGAVVVAAGVDGRPMLDVDARVLQRRVGALPWVGAVIVHRHWPATVTIDVVERVPAALGAGTAGEPAIVDTAGRVLAVGADAAAVLAAVRPPLAALQGLPVAGPPGSTLAPAAQEALKVLAALRTGPSQVGSGGSGATEFIVSSITRAADGSLSAALSPGPVRALFGIAVQVDAKALALRAVLAQVAARPPVGGVTIDVRVADAPVLTNGVLTDAQKGSSVSTTQRG